MKITKYPQSCLILEKNGRRAIIDPGSLVSAKYQAADLLPADLILITHEHPDHIDPAFLEGLLGAKKIPVIANASTAKLLGGKVTNVIKDNEKLSLEGFDITARELPHVLMVNGDPGPQNTGFVIDGTFFHSGDGLELEGLSVNTAAIPIAGPDISPKDVYSFIKQLGCKRVVPIHYDYFITDPEMLNNKYLYDDIEAIILANGESAEI